MMVEFIYNIYHNFGFNYNLSQFIFKKFLYLNIPTPFDKYSKNSIKNIYTLYTQFIRSKCFFN